MGVEKMSGIYIPGAKIPDGDYVRVLMLHKDGTCVDGIGNVFKAIPVPEPHGRLIDADALHKLFEDQWHYLQVLDWNENPTAEARQSGVNWCINTMHDSAPTIIEAEEGE